MRTIYTHITKQVLATLFLTVAVFTFVLILGNVLKEIVALLVNGQASLGLVAKALALLLPYVLVYALPIGLLSAVLLFFGRFSADQELTALRSSGVSLLNIAFPVLALSLLLSGFCAAINLQLGPAARAAYKDLLNVVDLQTTANLLPEATFITDIPGYWFYIGKKFPDHLEDVRIFTLKDGETDSEYYAEHGWLDINPDTRQIQLSLTNATALLRFPAKEKKGAEGTAAIPDESAAKYNWEWVAFNAYSTEPIEIKESERKAYKPKIGNMTLKQLRSELRIRRAALKNPPENPDSTAQPVDIVTPVLVQIHRNIAFSFACFSFTLIAIPLGIQTHRKETSVGVAMALILLAIYYTFLIVAQSLDTHPEWHPELLVWFPNFLFQGVGAFLLWKANRGI